MAYIHYVSNWNYSTLFPKYKGVKTYRQKRYVSSLAFQDEMRNIFEKGIQNRLQRKRWNKTNKWFKMMSNLGRNNWK